MKISSKDKFGSGAPGNIILSGFMCAGKSVVGRLVAERLGTGFRDIDEMAAEIAGMSVAEIFAGRGEEGFRLVEKEAVAALADSRGLVIALGGGTLISRENYEALDRLGVIFYLKASVPSILSRFSRERSERPLLPPGSREAAVEGLMRERAGMYAERGDFIIETDGLSEEECAELIIETIEIRAGAR